MDTSSGVMKGDVIASLKDDKGKQKLLVKNAAELDFNLDTEEFIGETLSKKDPAFKPVLIYHRDELEARALYFEYHGKKGIFYLKGDVYIVDKKNNRTITASELTYNTTNDTFEGKDVYLEIILEEGEQ
jgi:lipopolysaccharide export system protein LptA